MKQYLKSENLPWLTLLAGGIGLLLRVWLLSTEDEKGFVTRGHISGILLLVLTAAFAVMLFLLTRVLIQGSKYRFNFPASDTGGIGAAVAAAGIAIASVVELTAAADTLETFCALLGILSAAALLFVGHSRWKGLHPSTLFHIMICAWLVLRLICLYRSWSSEPQLEDYCFQLLAIVCAMLATYQRAAFDANFGKRFPHAFFSLASVYCCILSLAGPDGAVLYLSLGMWLFTDLCNLRAMPRRHRRENHEAA